MKILKRLISMVLCATVLLSMFATTASASDNAGIAPCLTNTATANTGFIIENGIAYVSTGYVGYSGIATGATITAKIQKRFLFFFWSDVIEWTDEVVGEQYLGEHTTSITEKGMYRAVATYRIHGVSGVDDVFTSEVEFNYQ